MSQETNTKTFSEIYSSLTEGQRADLRLRLVIALGVKDNTLWNWGSGKTNPINQKHREVCAEVLSDVIKQELSPETLFPCRA